MHRLRRTTFLCLVLLCICGAAQVLHSHPLDVVRGDSDKTRCTVCVAGHSPQQPPMKVSFQPSEGREIAVQAMVSHHMTTIADDSNRTRPPPSL
ncbi:MAG TPA: hypothetical protein VM009_04585 [Terriglobales bacterium]|nr:hypothetical protein [Terriglobales bacterium]